MFLSLKRLEAAGFSSGSPVAIPRRTMQLSTWVLIAGVSQLCTIGIFIIHNRWVWSLSSCQAAVCFPGDSCYWDSIPGFSKCHRKKRGMLAHSCMNCSLELIAFQKTTHKFALLMKITHCHRDVLHCDLTKTTFKNDFEPAQSYFLLLIFIGSLNYKLDFCLILKYL